MDVSQKNQHTISLSSEDLGERADLFLAHSKSFEDIIGKKLSRMNIARGIQRGGVLADSATIKPHTKLLKTKHLVIFPDKFAQQDKILTPTSDIPIAIVHETPDFAVINKPAGIQTHPSGSGESGTVAHWVLARYPEAATVGEPMRPGIVHRLDRDTSGLLVIARTKKAFTAFKRLFKTRAIQKRYLALVSGIPKSEKGTITTPIARSTRGDRQVAAIPGRRVKGVARPAETFYRTLKTFGETALLEVLPKTGRTHQIRVHLASIGHPVLGDTLYASRDSRTVSRETERQLLHAAGISFKLFGKPYSFSTPLPSDFPEEVRVFTNSEQYDTMCR